MTQWRMAVAPRGEIRTLSILIPCFNEARTIEAIVSRVWASPVDLLKDVVIVDDGSTDGSRVIIDRLAGENADTPGRSMTVVHHQRNLGKGAAVRSALERASGDVILIQDADLEYDPLDYPALLAPILDGSASVVFGTRRAHQRFTWKAPERWRFIAGGWLVTTIANLLLRTRLTDYATGYKVFTRRIAQSLALRSDGFEVDAEIAARVRQLGYQIVETPITYRARTIAEGKKIRAIDAWRAIRLLMGRWIR
jgi:glycosyltransferase involved in cell wall biosynthesis